ncbi:MAG: 6-phosphogluconolactonase [Candidatus Pacebacteria bacterium]|nr:6-phosphogluconolactonase [Candidatus Paceibacterota bacterium]
MKIIRSQTSAEKAGNKLDELLSQYTAHPILLMLSGGSGFSILEKVSDDVLGSNVTMCVLDERCSVDAAINNFLQLKQTDFFKRAEVQKVNVIATDIQSTDACSDVAVRWQSELRDWKNNNPNGVVIATMGIGEDGHTAGILPGENGIDFDSDEWIVSYSVPPEINQYTDRITATNTFLINQVDEAVVFAVGKNKYSVIKALDENHCDVHLLPLCVLSKMKSVRLYTDL